MQLARQLRAQRFWAVWLACWLVLLAALAPSPANAQAGRANNITVELVPAEVPRAGETFLVALHFQPVSEEWHGYWSNPGDAGIGMELDWDLPPGWQAGVPQYPVPQLLEISGLINHIYEGDYAVLVPISVPEGARAPASQTIRLAADYLACTDKICVPESAQLATSFDELAEPDRFAEWQGAIAPLIDSTARFETARGRLRLAIPLPASLRLDAPHVFVGNRELVQYGARQDFYREGDLLVAEIPLADSAVSQNGAVEGILSFGSGQESGVRFIAEPGEVPGDLPPLDPAREQTGGALALLLLAAMAGGLVLNVMPCVFPILSLKALSLARSGGAAGEARGEALAYTAGAVLACVALGGLLLLLRAGGEEVGWAFQLQEPGVVVALLVLASVLTANFAGLFEFPGLPIRGSGKPANAFVTGLLAAFVATPCTGPFMAAALGAALLLPPASALLLFASLGLGLALPFLLLGFVPALRRRLPAPGPWMERFRRWMALPMGLTALALVWLTTRIGGQGFALIAMVLLFGVLLAFAVFGRLQRAGKLAWPALALIAAPFLIFAGFAFPASYSQQAIAGEASLLSPQDFGTERLAEARASGRPVFVWFTADWCLTCKVNERVAIEREATRAAFEAAGVVAIRGDWTRRDPEITRFLAERGAAGVPLYLWYPAGGGEPEQLPQILTPDMLPELAESAAPPRN
ncbi:thiol:disulfide interchange protein [Altererythrobacter aurantiacus]|uniref:Thiol:disulfide interchange protein n=1 Tax=Parapontixanthobacter aurantiacus TaxID=1463599 RepID=A0A844ZB78_9SPHN|nr:thioredoxin family protein [Parapontixanthobacter aurantiacus]MXO85791.1 thiol:disulfide interchange protein [Parapontixanthobacter aurantiacus]